MHNSSFLLTELPQRDLPQGEPVRVQAAPLDRGPELGVVGLGIFRVGPGRCAARRIPRFPHRGAVARDPPAVPEATLLRRREGVACAAWRPWRLEAVPAPVAARHQGEEHLSMSRAHAAEGAGGVDLAAEGAVERLQARDVDRQGECSVAEHGDLRGVDADERRAVPRHDGPAVQRRRVGGRQLS